MHKADKSQEIEHNAVVTQGGAMKQNGEEIGSHTASTFFSRLKSYRLPSSAYSFTLIACQISRWLQSEHPLYHYLRCYFEIFINSVKCGLWVFKNVSKYTISRTNAYAGIDINCEGSGKISILPVYAQSFQCSSSFKINYQYCPAETFCQWRRTCRNIWVQGFLWNCWIVLVKTVISQIFTMDKFTSLKSYYCCSELC